MKFALNIMQKKFVFIFMVAQILLTWVSLHKDMPIATASTMDIVVMPLLVVGSTIIPAVWALAAKKGEAPFFIGMFTFLFISSINILGLLYIIYGVLFYGPLNESGLIFIAFPAYGFRLFIGGVISGAIIYYLRKYLEKRRINEKD